MFEQPPISVNVYIDGFNLYYRAVKDTPYRWLDLGALAKLVLPGHEIHRIRYFTARVAARSGDAGQPARQNTYLRALETVPHLAVHYGHFLSKRNRRPLVNPPPAGPRTVEIWDTEEKGSDVNLASLLLSDGYSGDYEMAVVVTNDSDLELPIRLVRDLLQLPVGVLDPSTNRGFALAASATWYRRLRRGPIEASQFPDTLSDATGRVTKPPGW